MEKGGILVKVEGQGQGAGEGKIKERVGGEEEKEEEGAINHQAEKLNAMKQSQCHAFQVS